MVSSRSLAPVTYSSFFFNDPATTEIYTLSLHDALPIFEPPGLPAPPEELPGEHLLRGGEIRPRRQQLEDRKSTRLNSSHITISYAVFCLKKKITHLTDHDGLSPQQTRHLSRLRTQRSPA